MESIVYYDKGTKEYPERMMPFSDMPEGIYVKGRLPRDDRPSAAIVGGRVCSAYGREQARRFAREMAASGVQIISGLASGIDAAAHEGALEGGGTTFAVLGCGVNICYPRENYPLMRKILGQKGGVLSEFPPGERPLAWHFPQRNRLISALADLVLVVEARKKSGSLITADFALEQGKSVYALPGRVNDSLSEGSNRLIAQGAGIAVEPNVYGRGAADPSGIGNRQPHAGGTSSDLPLSDSAALFASGPAAAGRSDSGRRKKHLLSQRMTAGFAACYCPKELPFPGSVFSLHRPRESIVPAGILSIAKRFSAAGCRSRSAG